MKEKITYLLLVINIALSLLFYIEFEKLDYFLVSLLFTVLFYLGHLIWNNRYEKKTIPNAKYWSNIFLNIFCGNMLYENILHIIYIFIGTDTLFNIFGIAIKGIFIFLCFMSTLIFEVTKIAKIINANNDRNITVDASDSKKL